MEHNSSVSRHIQDWLYAIAGILFATFALKSFLVPNHFIDGGVTGISLFLHEVFHINIAAVIILTNLPFIIMGGIQVNKWFAIKSLVCISLFAISLLYIPFPIVTNDNLLISIFGGFFLGLGIGLAMRAGFALDGIEVLALYTLKRTSFKISEIILGINVVIFILAAFHFQLSIALYAMLTYFVATRTIDYVVEGLEEYTGVTIISGHSEIIKEKLVKDFGRGITIYKGERGYLKESYETRNDCDIIFAVVTRFEVRRMRIMVQEIDSKAFVFTNAIREVAGGVLKKKHHSH